MNQLINLSSDYVVFDISDKKNQKVKVVGTYKHPYFCGKDLCEILGYVDVHDALYRHVKIKHKKDLKTLVSELSANSADNFFGSEHLKNITYHSGKAVYVNEPGLYSLIMKSKASFAEAFQDLVYEVILPSIRQHGQYKINKELSEAMKNLQFEKERAVKAEQAKLKAEQAREEATAKLRSETKRLKDQIQRTLEYNQATKQVEPLEYIYIVTTESNQRKSKFKLGGCQSFELVKSRLSQYNTGESDSEGHFFVYLKKTVSYRAVEQSILGMMAGFRENQKKELYYIHYDWLVKCVDAIMDGNAEFASFVNDNRMLMAKDTVNKEPTIVPPIQLEQIKVMYLKAGDAPLEVTSMLEKSVVDLIKGAIESFKPENNLVDRSKFEKHLVSVVPDLKLDNKRRTIWDVAKQIGSSVNPMWRYKY